MAEERKPAAKAKKAEIDPKAHKRALLFLNAARAPKDLLELPLNEIEVDTDPEHVWKGLPRKRFDTHEPVEKKRQRTFFTLEQAKRLLTARKELDPQNGFTHLYQLEKILGPNVFKGILELLLKWFSRLSHGEWSEPIPLEDEDGLINVVHAAVVHTGHVVMIEHACHDGISKTPLWNPDTRATKTPSPTPPSEGDEELEDEGLYRRGLQAALSVQGNATQDQ